jgi:hypothetical protein
MMTPVERCKHLWYEDDGERVCTECGKIDVEPIFDGHGAREAPAPADEGHLGTPLNSEIKRWRGEGEVDGAGFRESVKDAQGHIVTPNWMLLPDRQHSLRHVYDDKSQKTWEELQIQKFWVENCDRMDRGRLELAVKVLQDHIDRAGSEYRKEIRRFRMSLGQ